MSRQRWRFQIISSRWRQTVALAVAVLYISLFLFYRHTSGTGVSALLILPTMAVGWALGLRAGFLAGLLSMPVSSLFLATNSSAEWTVALRGTNLLEVTAVVLAGMVGGYVHDMGVRAKREVGERQFLEDTLRRNEEWSRLLCEHAQLGCQSLDETGHLIEVNQAWLDTFGYTREGIIGRWFGDFLAPNQQALFMECFSKFKTAGETRGVGLEMVSKAGEPIAVSFDGQISYNGPGEFRQAHCILVDVAGRKRAEEALRAERDRAQQYLNIAGVMLVALNTDQTIALINRKGCEILGCREERVIGKNWFDLFVPERVRDEVKRVFELLLSGDVEGVEYFENPVVAQAGEERLIAWYNTILTDASGRITGMLSSGEDITERKRMEENLRQAHDELEVRVQKRTVELSQANELLQQEIAERKRAEAAEEEQRALAEALRDTAAALNSTLNFEEVLDQILANLERVVQHRTGNIMLVEGDQVHVVRWRGYEGYVPDEAMRSIQLSISNTATLRWMVETGQPLIIADVTYYQGWTRLEPNAWIRSYAGAPIRSDGQVIGFINLDSAEPNCFRPIHAEGLRAFVDQAAIAIENARLYSQAQTLAAMEERNRIAHDLHDAVSQTLWSACLIADGLQALWENDPSEGRQNLATLRQMTRGALAEMRTLLLELRPSALTEVDLGELLRQLTQAFTGRFRVPVALTVQGRELLPAQVQVALYRIAQEALNNIVRHAAASQVDVYLHSEPGLAELHISDNGLGFSPESIPPGHLGLGIMRERAESIGARLKIDSQVGRGTTIEITWTEG